MAQGMIQTLLVRLPLSYYMSIQPDASLTRNGLAAPISTAVGVLICMGFYLYLKKSPDTKLALAKGLAMGLEFKLGSEILRTVILRSWQEIGIVAGIIVLRAALTFLIHWEIRQEMKEKRGQE